MKTKTATRWHVVCEHDRACEHSPCGAAVADWIWRRTGLISQNRP